MRLPPPVRFTAPLIALTFGLVVTWFDYRLNLGLDLARHLEDIRNRADSNGGRLALASSRHLAAGDVAGLQARVESTPDIPAMEIVGVVDESGKIIADSTGALRGQAVSTTQLAPAGSLINAAGQSRVQEREDAHAVVSAHPFSLGARGTGWALLVISRDKATAAAKSDALRQLRWMASAMFLLAFALWTLLHFGFAARLAKLAAGVRAFGEGESDQPATIGGGDEVAELSRAFAAMTAKLKSREEEQHRLEGELLETSERERRRIGHELHDGIGQELTAALLATNGLSTRLQSASPALVPHAEALAEQLTRTMAEVRSLSRGLAPVPLWESGLVDALQALADATSQNSGVRCVFDGPDRPAVPDPATAGHLYRIAQEAVTNALKHASPREIRIGLERRDGILQLEIEDDGEGMAEPTKPEEGLGLRTMRHRASTLGGHLVFDSAPAGGTRVSVQIPWPS